MFSKNFKNIYINLKKENFQRAKKYTKNILHVLKYQNGGELPENIKRALTTMQDDSHRFIMILEFLLNYIDKFEIKDVSEIKNDLELMKNTLQQRLTEQRLTEQQ